MNLNEEMAKKENTELFPKGNVKILLKWEPTFDSWAWFIVASAKGACRRIRITDVKGFCEEARFMMTMLKRQGEL